MGGVFIAVGLLVVWAAFRGYASEGVPAWVAAGAGLMFVTAGGMVMINFGVEGHMGPDGQLSPDTPAVVRFGNLLLTLTFVGLLAAVFGWIGFGPGTREFSTSVSVPFVKTPAGSSETLGRALFGGFAVLCALTFVIGVIKSVRGRGRDS